MKRHAWLIFLIILITSSCLIYIPYDEGQQPPRRERPSEREYQDYYPGMDISYFYNYLSPYGTWVDYPRHGYVWIPRHVSYRWRPFTNGRWVWTDYGWTWVSYFEWGWIPFHYGRWGWDDDLGWFWVPDTVWGPAWVTWRYGDFYIGWAPLPPGVFLGEGIYSLPYELPHHCWTFIEGRYFWDEHFDRYVLPYERNISIINLTVNKTNIYFRNNRVINEGIDIDQMRKVTRHEVTKYELKDLRRPGLTKVGFRDVEIYRPSLKKNEAAKPRVVLNKAEAKEKISGPEVLEPRSRFERDDEESELRKEQEQERQLLERSQEEEVINLKRKADEEKRLARDPADKERIDKDYEAKITELKKSHEGEKSELKKRQQKEEEQVKKKKIKKD